MSTSTYRLPLHVTPRRYDLWLDAQLGREDFSGQVVITLRLHQATDTIDLHARELAILDANLIVNGQTCPAAVTLDPDNERMVLQFPQTFPAGEASLALTFRGKVSQTLKGLYLAQDRPEQLLCTQCEATDARAIFPCFDEPAFKAQFALEVTTPDPVVLANTPLLSVTDNHGTKTWKFAPTKTMSSYLVALVIGDVASTAEKVVNGIPLRVWAMRGKEHMGTFALDYTARLLPWYEEYFGTPYHFDKYDQAAVPGFAAGAMENSGLVVFRQNLLLMEPETSSWKQEKAMAHVIAHEFAHMWFGNLVTMQWWDDLWLNEAFADWMSLRVISEISPEYHIWNDFEEVKNYALTEDALANTHPIYSQVETPAQAEELFDAITYLKGCAVLRMLETFLGSDTFRSGLRTYMQEFAERNACGADLWRHLQAASQQPVTQIMESWILQGGYPCVTVTPEGPQLQFSQRRFFAKPQSAQDQPQLWHIPLLIRYQDDAGTHEHHYLLSEATAAVHLPIQGELQWCYPNTEQIGFYRQSLSPTLLDKTLLHLDQLSAAEQIGFLSDQWALTRSGQQSITTFLNVLTAMSAHTEHHNVLSDIVQDLKTLEQMVEDLGNTMVLQRYRLWVKSLFEARLKSFGFEPQPGESMEVSQQRISVIKAMTILAHDPEAVAQARVLAEREAADAQSVDPNLAAILVEAHAQFGNDELFKRYVDIYQQRKTNGAPPQTVNRYLYSFAAFRLPELVKQTLSLLEEGVLPREATLPVLYQMLDSHHSQIAAWEYIKSNWQTIKELGIGTSEVIKDIGKLPYSMRGDLVEFCEVNVKGIADIAYGQALETMDLLAEFQARTKQDLVTWWNHAGLESTA
ncbi:MAG TPA: M1 family metallopeptidase [Anaerolineales bacterium]|nr:M1 family metallopeptidase [Anaerolineales bacterium]